MTRTTPERFERLTPVQRTLLSDIVREEFDALQVELFGAGVLPPERIAQLVEAGILPFAALTATGAVGGAWLLGRRLSRRAMQQPQGHAAEVAAVAAAVEAGRPVPRGRPTQPVPAEPAGPVPTDPAEPGPADPAEPPGGSRPTPAPPPPPERPRAPAPAEQAPAGGAPPSAPAPAPPPSDDGAAPPAAPPPAPPGGDGAGGGPPARPPEPEPLLEHEQNQIDAARERGGNYIQGTGNQVDQDLQTVLISSDNEQAREYRQRVREQVAEGLANRESISQIRARVAEQALDEDYARDIDRIVATEIAAAVNAGFIETILNTAGVEANVAVVLSAKPCRKCRELYTKGGTPRIFKAAQLPAWGANFGQKTENWVATVPPLHPWCGCALVYLPDGWTIDADGNMHPGRAPS